MSTISGLSEEAASSAAAPPPSFDELVAMREGMMAAAAAGQEPDMVAYNAYKAAHTAYFAAADAAPPRVIAPEPGAVVTAETLRVFYAKHDPAEANKAAECVGKFESEKILEMLQTKYGAVPGITNAKISLDGDMIDVKHVLGSDCSDLQFAEMCQSAAGSGVLVSLDSSGCTNLSVSGLLAGSLMLSCLTELSVDGCNLGDSAATIILAESPLTSLNVARNDLRSSGAELLATALTTNTKLVSVNLSSNLIAGFCAGTMYELGNDEITKRMIPTSTGPTAIAAALKRNTAIKRLTMGDAWLLEHSPGTTSPFIDTFRDWMHDNGLNHAAEDRLLVTRLIDRSYKATHQNGRSHPKNDLCKIDGECSDDSDSNYDGWSDQPEYCHKREHDICDEVAAAMVKSGIAPASQRNQLKHSFLSKFTGVFTLDTGMTELNLSGKQISASEALVVSAFLPKCKQLDRFIFSGDWAEIQQSGYNFQGNVTFSKHVTMESSMTEADFSGKRLLNSGITMLACFLPRCQALTKLNISNNSLHHNSRWFNAVPIEFVGEEAEYHGAVLGRHSKASGSRNLMGPSSFCIALAAHG
jgi:hypothetical protein